MHPLEGTDHVANKPPDFSCARCRLGGELSTCGCLAARQRWEDAEARKIRTDLAKTPDGRKLILAGKVPMPPTAAERRAHAAAERERIEQERIWSEAEAERATKEAAELDRYYPPGVRIGRAG